MYVTLLLGLFVPILRANILDNVWNHRSSNICDLGTCPMNTFPFVRDMVIEIT